MKSFEGLGLSPALNKSLAHMKYTTPTPIQAQAIPLALEGHDIMGTAQTGTGKTAAFAIPLVERLLNNPDGSALVLTPTRELGKQIMDIMNQLLGPKSTIRTAFIIGGEQMSGQIKQLRNNPRLIVGTPGRINDHLRRGNMLLHDTDFLVLDETDRMLDMGFTEQLDEIFEHMPSERQTMMFSATLPPNILKISQKYMNKPKRVSVGETNVVAKNIKQEVIRIEQDKKYEELKTQLLERNGSIIVFVKTKYNADKMALNLRRDGYTSEALHGDLRQRKRDRVMQNFRKMNFRILIATDIAARGLDVPHIEHVINYDLPQVAEDFIHRMGRTARAGAEGSAISFVSNQDGRKWHAIERLLDPNAKSDDGQRRKQKRGANSNNKPKRKTSFNKRSDNDALPFKKKKKFEGKKDVSNGDGKRNDIKKAASKRDDTKRSDAKNSDTKKNDGKKSFKNKGAKRKNFKRKDSQKPYTKKSNAPRKGSFSQKRKAA